MLHRLVVDPLGVNLSTKVAEVGLAFSATLAGVGGTPGYTFTIASGLPAGLTFDAGAIAGTPTASGSFSIPVAITDADGLSSTVAVPLTVVAKLKLAGSLAPATVGRSYNAHIVVRGGARPLRFAITHGKLPTGIRLNVRTGVLAGTPRAAGTFRVRVAVRDALGAVANRTLVLSVG